jgi:hypothetical protein
MSKVIVDLPVRKPIVVLDKAPEGMPETHLDQPCTYVWTPVLPREKIVNKKVGWTIDGTKPGFLEEVVSETKRYIAGGNEPFLPEKHKSAYDARDNRGFVKDAKLDGDWVWLLEQLIGEDAKKYKARNKSSIELSFAKVDGNGKQYKNVITHNALCPDPVVPGAGGYVAMSDSAGGPGDLVAVFQFDEAAERSTEVKLTKKQRERFAALLGKKPEEIPEEADEKFFDATLDRAEELAKRPEKAAASESEPTLTAREQTLVARSLAGKKVGLVQRGISKAVVDKLEKVFVDGGKLTEIAMSETAPGVTVGETVFEILEENVPVKLGSSFGHQSSPARASVSASEGGDEEKEEQAKITQALSSIGVGPRKA